MRITGSICYVIDVIRSKDMMKNHFRYLKIKSFVKNLPLTLKNVDDKENLDFMKAKEKKKLKKCMIKMMIRTQKALFQISIIQKMKILEWYSEIKHALKDRQNLKNL